MCNRRPRRRFKGINQERRHLPSRTPVPIGANRTAGQAALLLLVSGATGSCTHWKTQSVIPAEYVGARQPRVVRISRTDGRRLVLHRPEVVGDTMYSAPPGRKPAVPVSEIETIAVRRIDPWGTMGVTLGIVAVGAAGVIAAMWSERAD
jgi:hypothetical protein